MWTVTTALFAQGCCCFLSVPLDRGDGVGSSVLFIAYALLPLAVALAYYQRQARKHQPAWAARWMAKLDAGGAYRRADVALETISIPSVVRLAGCLGFVHTAASLPPLLEGAHLLRGAWLALGGPGRTALWTPSMATGLFGLVVALDVGTAFLGSAVLACKVRPRLTRLVGGLLVVESLILISGAILEWGPLLRDLAALLNQPLEGPPTYGPNALTQVAGITVIAGPMLGMASGVAFVRGASELAESSALTAPV